MLTPKLGPQFPTRRRQFPRDPSCTTSLPYLSGTCLLPPHSPTPPLSSNPSCTSPPGVQRSFTIHPILPGSKRSLASDLHTSLLSGSNAPPHVPLPPYYAARNIEAYIAPESRRPQLHALQLNIKISKPRPRYML